MKTLKKCIVILLLSIILIVLIAPPAKADVILDPNSYEPQPFDDEDSRIAGNITGQIFSTIRTLGIVLSVLVITVIGIKYMLCSVEEKAQYKETAIPLIIGCLLLAGSTTLVSLIYTIATS